MIDRERNGAMQQTKYEGASFMLDEQRHQARSDAASRDARVEAEQGQLPTLRVLTCGSGAAGKSTLIGRLLDEAMLVHDDTLLPSKAGSAVDGATDDAIDLARRVDGCRAEREPGTTTDVAYHQFATGRRKFIVADAPGHEQFTRYMVAGASRCDLALVLVDARMGVTRQTRRHAYIAHLLGIRSIVLAVNKMDLVEFDRSRFDEVVASFRSFADGLAFENVVAMPLSALSGDNLTGRSARLEWYGGPSLLTHLETAVIDRDVASVQVGMRMPVQWVCRTDPDFRGSSGTLASGRIKPGDEVMAVPSLQTARVKRIVTKDGDLDEARAGDAVVLTFDREIDTVRGDVLSAPKDVPEVADQFAAHIIWMTSEPMLQGRPYTIVLATQTATAQISDIRHIVSMDSREELSGRRLNLNDVGLCNFSVNHPLVLEPYTRCRDLGGFILIDRTTNETVAAGMIRHGLRRAHNIQWQKLSIDQSQRVQLKGHRGACLWFTGLSGSGKSTIANELEKLLIQRGIHTYIMDGDNVRHGLCRDLGFTDADRVENIRRVAEVARLMVDAGLVTIVSFISPFRAERQFARERFDEADFIEIFIDTPIEVCEARDPKGLYRKARANEIANFTGISSPYEPPLDAECRLLAGEVAPAQLARIVLDELIARGVIRSG